MGMVLLAQVAAWGLAQWAIAIIIVCAVVAIVFIGVRQMGVTIPPFIINILWILFVALICIAAIKFLLSA